jgi:hypothetical protein
MLGCMQVAEKAALGCMQVAQKAALAAGLQQHRLCTERSCPSCAYGRAFVAARSDLLGAKQAARGAGASGRPEATQAVH